MTLILPSYCGNSYPKTEQYTGGNENIKAKVYSQQL